VGQLRCFVAIELPEAVKRELTRIQSQLKNAGNAPAKWVDPQGIHLTLQFLGDVDEILIPRVSEAVRLGCAGSAPFGLALGGPGVFPNPARPRVVWVGLTGDLDSLNRLQQGIEVRLKDLGFTPEDRAFTPHLTLARVREEAAPPERQKLGKIVTEFKPAAAGFRVTEVSLMRSQLNPGGAIYTRLSAAELKQ